MRVRSQLALGLLLTFGFCTFFTNTAIADGSVCPDLHQHEEVRSKGEAELLNLRSVRGPGPGFGDTTIVGSPRVDDFLPFKDTDTADLPVLMQMYHSGVWSGLGHQQFHDLAQARDCFQSAIDQSDQPTDEDLARKIIALEALANLYVSAGQENLDVSPTRMHGYEYLKDKFFPVSDSIEQDPIWKLDALIEAKQTKSRSVPLDGVLRKNLNRAEQNYRNAIERHRVEHGATSGRNVQV